jgi:site-specific DNA-methyltransferase (cytosine-N4-specific)
MVQKSDLPFGSEFSPSQIELPELLEIVERNQGNWKKLEAEILKTYFSKHGSGGDAEMGTYNRGKLANNCKLGMIAYGVIDREANFTEFGKRLYEARKKSSALYDTLAKHILLNLHGMRLVQCIQDMAAAGDEVNLTSLRHGLAARGLHYPSGGKHPSIMRLWLAKAGVILGSRWQVDETKLRAILGTGSEEFEQLGRFTAEQKAFLRALANTGTKKPQPANAIAALASATYGVKFPEKSLPNLVLKALVEAGYITAKKTTEGRGAKPFLVSPTKKLETEIIEPLLEQLKDQVDPKLIGLLKRPLSDILKQIHSKDRYVAGLALEALAFKLMRLLDVTYVATRLRAEATGGAEIDLIFDSARLVFSRWQVQCKNTKRVSLDDVAKEVGLTNFLKSNAIVVVTTGEIGSQARRFSNKIMADSNLAIVLIDGTDLARIEANSGAIIDVFQREARSAMKLKSIDPEGLK